MVTGASYYSHDLTVYDNPLQVIEVMVMTAELIDKPVVLNCTDKMKLEQCYTVYVDMVGDLFHVGHMNMCRQALNLASTLTDKKIRLIVGLCDDKVCEDYKRLPMNTLAERTAAATGCRFVDAVLFPAPLFVTEELLDTCHVDLVVHGDDFSEEKARFYYGAAMDRGIYKTVPYTPGISTSELVGRIQARPPVVASRIPTS